MKIFDYGETGLTSRINSKTDGLKSDMAFTLDDQSFYTFSLVSQTENFQEKIQSSYWLTMQTLKNPHASSVA